jgi:hypothetical protein
VLRQQELRAPAFLKAGTGLGFACGRRGLGLAAVDWRCKGLSGGKMAG